MCINNQKRREKMAANSDRGQITMEVILALTILVMIIVLFFGFKEKRRGEIDAPSVPTGSQMKLAQIYHLKNKWQQLSWNHQLMVIAVVLLALLFLLQVPGESPAPLPYVNPKVDTLIPNGYTLFPLNIENHASLEGLLGAKGVLHLISASTGKSVVKGLKVIRAPNNSSMITAVVRATPENLWALNNLGPFKAILENPTQWGGTNFVKRNKKRRRKILINSGEE